jgi:hypothetical protein
LQYKSRIKKFVLPDGYDELSIARLQLAFIEKFSWNTHSNGEDLPEIYIQDPVSGYATKSKTSVISRIGPFWFST